MIKAKRLIQLWRDLYKLQLEIELTSPYSCENFKLPKNYRSETEKEDLKYAIQALRRGDGYEDVRADTKSTVNHVAATFALQKVLGQI